MHILCNQIDHYHYKHPSINLYINVDKNDIEINKNNDVDNFDEEISNSKNIFVEKFFK